MAPAESVQARLRAVREALGLTQLLFLPVLNRQAAVQGVRDYTQSTLSKLESGSQAVTLSDVAVFAAVDPLHRGKLWLGWGEEADATRAVVPSGDVIRVAGLEIDVATLERVPDEELERLEATLTRIEAERAALEQPERHVANDRRARQKRRR